MLPFSLGINNNIHGYTRYCERQCYYLIYFWTIFTLAMLPFSLGINNNIHGELAMTKARKS